jgi:hypothetical protein
VDHVLDTTLKCFQPAHDPENGVHYLSVPVKRLKGVFVDPIDEYLHVIVQPSVPGGERQSLWLVLITHCGIVSYPPSFGPRVTSRSF